MSDLSPDIQTVQIKDLMSITYSNFITRFKSEYDSAGIITKIFFSRPILTNE